MFQVRSGKVDEFVWWYMDTIQSGSGTKFTHKEFQEGFSTRGVLLSLAAPDHQEINGQVEVTWWTLQTIANSIMVRVRFSEEYIHFSFI